MTSRSSSARSPWGGVDLLERAVGYTRGSLALVTPQLMAAPTPCRGWNLRALLTHMHDSLTSLHEAGSVRRVGLGPTPEAGPAAPVDLVEALRLRACELLADWSLIWGEDRLRESAGLPRSPDVLVDDRPLTPRVLASAGALEVAVHGWDVARACGVHRPLPDGLASDLLRVAPLIVSPADRPSRFAPPVPPPGPTPGEELLAFLGRR